MNMYTPDQLRQIHEERLGIPNNKNWTEEKLSDKSENPVFRLFRRNKAQR